MKRVIFTILAISFTAKADLNIQKYQPSANKYLVGSKEVSAAEAVSAALKGQQVFQCTEKVLAEGKSGISFKSKK